MELVVIIIWLDRPSSWPVRNQRRHAAAANFNMQVLGSLSQMATKLDKIEHLDDAVTQLAQRINELVLTVHGLPLRHEEPEHPNTDDLEKRIASMELLLFRTPLPKFDKIDTHTEVHEERDD